MFTPSFKLILALGFAGLCYSAEATALYDYSYKFSDGNVMSGSFNGTADGDIVHIEDGISVYVNNLLITNDTSISTSHFTMPELVFRPGGAVASFDGSKNNFKFDYQPWPGHTISPFLSIIQGFQHEFHWQGGGTLEKPSWETISSAEMSAKWTLKLHEAEIEVPEPASTALLALGLIAMGGFSRWKRS